MNGFEFTFSGENFVALGSGALWWPDQSLLCVSDLHLGKSERTLRRGGPALPPYDTRDTLARLSSDLEASRAKTVLCLGDSFDDLGSALSLSRSDSLHIAAMQAGRQWIWIEGNHDPGPIDIAGTHLYEWTCGPLIFRHIAEPNAQSEISGHFHPKARLKIRGNVLSRPAFLVDCNRVILPAYGTYTGGLRSSEHPLTALMGADALAILTGPNPAAVPMPR